MPVSLSLLVQAFICPLLEKCSLLLFSVFLAAWWGLDPNQPSFQSWLLWKRPWF